MHVFILCKFKTKSGIHRCLVENYSSTFHAWHPEHLVQQFTFLDQTNARVENIKRLLHFYQSPPNREATKKTSDETIGQCSFRIVPVT